MVILRTRNKITDFLMILAWASPFKCRFNHRVSILLSLWIYIRHISLAKLLLYLFLDKIYF